MANDIHVAIAQWRDALVNLTGTNRLLSYKPNKVGTIEFTQDSSQQIFTKLMSGQTTFVVGTKPTPPKARPADEIAPEDLTSEMLEAQLLELTPPFDYDKHPGSLFANKTQADVDRALRTLATKARNELLDRGLSILYVAFGALDWVDEREEKRTSPLILVPVQLVTAGTKQPHSIEVSDDDIVVNPALTLKLASLGFELPSLEDISNDLEKSDLEAALNKFRQVDLDAGWSIRDFATLRDFAFAKEAMYRDLLDNEPLISENLQIQALGNGGDLDFDHFKYDEIDPNEMDRVAPPEKAQLVLDADSSQRAAVEAALQGRSFALDGPPGTGKSQTIANMIGGLIKEGKTVLFVSEKIVALEVVRERLKERGLDQALFELHSSKSSRKDVAARLGKALGSISEPASRVSDDDVERALRARTVLSEFATAMNERREPLGMSFFEAVGRLESLAGDRATPALPLSAAELSRPELLRLEEASAGLAKNWDLYLLGEESLWFGLQNGSNLDFDIEEAANALEALQAEIQTHEKLFKAFQAKDLEHVDWVISALEVWRDHSDGVPRDWFTKLNSSAIASELANLNELLKRKTSFESGIKRWDMSEVLQSPALSREGIPQNPSKLIGLHPNALSETFDWFENTHEEAIEAMASIAKLTQSRKTLEEVSGLVIPNSINGLDEFSQIASVAFGATEMPTRWLLQRRARENSAKALEDFSLELSSTSIARNHADCFSDSALQIDIAGLAQSITLNSGPFAFLNRDFRAAKKQLRAFATGPWGEVKTRLPQAVAWQQANQRLEHAQEKAKTEIGALFSGSGQNVKRVAELLSLAGKFSKMAEVADDEIFELIWSSDARLKKVSDALESVRALLEPWANIAWAGSSLIAGKDRALSLEDLHKSLEVVRDEVRVWVEFGKKWSGLTVSPSTVGDARDLSQTRFDFDNLNMDLDRSLPEVSAALALDVPINHDNIRTRADELVRIHEKFEAIRSEISPEATTQVLLSSLQLKALESSESPIRLISANERWDSSAKQVLDRFESSKSESIAKEFAQGNSASQLLSAFKAGIQDVDRWFHLQESVELLENAGLIACLETAKQNSLDESEIHPFIVRSILNQWLNHTYESDSRLRDDPKLTRSELVQKFRNLDLGLQDRAAEEIIDAVNKRRPKSFTGEANIIQREAEKQRRHIPVRDLVSKTRNAIQAIHPCFMMSPLSVSQYLPSDLKFDVVIFDEASQVTPSDAINCIYRGDALIAAGDQKQLPPTSFFSAGLSDSEDEEEEDFATDFESILDLMKGGSFGSQTLLWHYRSRHEHLIAFSNTSFYENRLLTFPGAIDESEELGVKFFKVNGRYKRSAGRNNPVEAQEVAKRVMHHFETRPDLSLGVVTFSKAQQETVQQAVDLARKDHEHLDKYFDRATDRKDSFFIKNLETVQGDERDVMIFSIGYGPDDSGKVRNQFGPLNGPGGARRLNVAVTRAKRLVEVVSSMSASDITAGQSQGARHLRRYLDFAERGPAALEIELGSEGRDTDSPFEDSVIDVIRGLGYDVQPQVGVGGFRIDIGVKHPNSPGVFMLGVECDGAAYHSSRVARDRDRLRHEILEGLGWRIHHIWGTSWWRQRDREIAKLKEALEEQTRKPIVGRLVAREQKPRTEPIKILTRETVSSSEREWLVDYEITVLEHGVDLIEPFRESALKTAIETIVATESPIHVELLVKRLRENSNVERIGNNIRSSINRAIDRSKEITGKGEILWWGSKRGVEVRRPSDHETRVIESVPDAELDQAILYVVRDSAGINETEAIKAVAEAFGWTRVGEKIRNGIQARIAKLQKSKRVAKSGDSLTTG